MQTSKLYIVFIMHIPEGGTVTPSQPTPTFLLTNMLVTATPLLDNSHFPPHRYVGDMFDAVVQYMASLIMTRQTQEFHRILTLS